MAARHAAKRAAARSVSIAGSLQAPSEFTIAAIPWMNHRRLAGIAQRLARVGDSSPSVWKKVISRADVILHSFTPWDICLLLNAKSHVQFRDASFLKRLCGVAVRV